MKTVMCKIWHAGK